jgi:hypothetical protein
MPSQDQSIWVSPRNSSSRAQGIFLHELAARTPEVLKYLRERVLPEYRSVYPETSAEKSRGPRFQRVKNFVGWIFADEAPQIIDADFPDIVLWRNVALLEQGYPAISAIKKLVLSWAQEFRLTDDWLLDTAMQTLYRMNKVSMLGRPHFWRFSGFDVPPLEMDRTLTFVESGWDPNLQSWRQFRDSVVAAFDDHLKQYRSEVEAFFKKAGWKPAREIRQRAHYTWLVMYQVKGWSPARIAEKFAPGAEESTITHGVENAAKAAGVTLRASFKGKGSRPRRAKK